jgi:hypothetical protein
MVILIWTQGLYPSQPDSQANTRAPRSKWAATSNFKLPLSEALSCAASPSLLVAAARTLYIRVALESRRRTEFNLKGHHEPEASWQRGCWGLGAARRRGRGARHGRRPGASRHVAVNSEMAVGRPGGRGAECTGTVVVAPSPGGPGAAAGGAAGAGAVGRAGGVERAGGVRGCDGVGAARRGDAEGVAGRVAWRGSDGAAASGLPRGHGWA